MFNPFYRFLQDTKPNQTRKTNDNSRSQVFLKLTNLKILMPLGIANENNTKHLLTNLDLNQMQD